MGLFSGAVFDGGHARVNAVRLLYEADETCYSDAVLMEAMRRGFRGIRVCYDTGNY